MDMKSLKKLILICTISILTFVFSYTLLYAQKNVSEKEKYGGTLTIAMPFDPKSLDIRYITGTGTSAFGYEKMYERLVDYSERGTAEIVPALAESWKQVNDTTWLVYLRKGVKFHNGKELTIEDILKVLDWKLNSKRYLQEKGWKPPLGGFAEMAFIDKIEKVDKYTLKFTMKMPYGPFVNIILWKLLQGVIDPDIVEKYEKQATLHPIGTGPFKFVEWVSGDHITMERFNDYWGGKAYLDRVIFRTIPDGQTRLIALQKGEVDVATPLDLNYLPIIKRDPRLGYFLVRDSANTGGVFFFNLRRWPMNQLKFRQAIAMGVDWVKVTTAAFPEGAAVPFQRTHLKGSWAENPEAEKLILPYNPQKARALLKGLEKEAEKPLPKSIDCLAVRGQILTDVLQMAAGQLKKIGVNLQVREVEQSVRSDLMKRNPKIEWEIGVNNNNSPSIDPCVWAVRFNSKAPQSADKKNLAGYENPEFDRLADRAVTLSDRNERKKLYQQMEKIILRDLPCITIFNSPRLFGYNKKVHDLRGHESWNIYLKTSWNNVWKEK
jgi:peptide/nickel transport system substrate-binding protein